MRHTGFVLKSTDPDRPGYLSRTPHAFYTPMDELFITEDVLAEGVALFAQLRHAQDALLVAPAHLPELTIKEIVITAEEFDV